MSIANTFNSLKANTKEQYSDEKPKKKRFGKLKASMNPGIEASKNPEKFLKDKSYLNLKGRKGVAV